MSQRTVLVVEDEPTLRQAVADRLAAEGFAVLRAGDGPSAVRVGLEAEPDVVLLDIMLPGFDGYEVCRQLTAARPVAVLMLTARDDEADQLLGLGVGADDYLTKPFSMRVLVARVRALVRRVERAEQAARANRAPRRLGDLVLDEARRTVTVDGEPVHLTRTEFDLLTCLAERPGEVLRRDELLREVWDWADASTRTVDSHVRSLRSKIGGHRVRTVHGVGYALEDGTP